MAVMRARHRLSLWVLGALFLIPPSASADTTKEAKPWCAPELETLPGNVCYAPDPTRNAQSEKAQSEKAQSEKAQSEKAQSEKAQSDTPKRRTAVIFLHGLVPAGAGWQHHQHRAILRGAREHGFSVFAPRGREGVRPKEPMTVAWPTSATAKEEHEQAVLAEWKAAIDLVEEREGRPFDEVFVLGFSNGAYYTGSLAIRAPHPFDGYAVFAGGRAYGTPTRDHSRRAPVFVGICTKDSTAADGQSLAATLSKHGWTYKAERRAAGHTMTDRHLTHAMAFLRKSVDEAREVQPPETDAPETDAPETDAPETDAPETDAPETDAPETDAPETDAPEGHDEPTAE